MGQHQIAERFVSGAVEFDAAEALGRVDNDRELLCEVIGSFLENIRYDLDELDALIATGDSTGAHKVAHRIKGGYGAVGAGGLVALAFQLERDGEASIEEMAERARAIREHTRALESELRRFLAG